MIDFWDFAHKNAVGVIWAAMFLGFIILFIVNRLIRLVLELINRSWRQLMRTLVMRRHGWPPPWVDADGDLHLDDPEPAADIPAVTRASGQRRGGRPAMPRAPARPSPPAPPLPPVPPTTSEASAQRFNDDT